jgi:hypothetical protein
VARYSLRHTSARPKTRFGGTVAALFSVVCVIVHACAIPSSTLRPPPLYDTAPNPPQLVATPTCTSSMTSHAPPPQKDGGGAQLHRRWRAAHAKAKKNGGGDRAAV